MRTRGFTLFWLGSAISAVGSSFTTIAIPIIAVQQLGATPAQMGFLFAAATATSLVLRFPTAAWADRSAAGLSVVAAGQMLSGILIAAIPVLWALSAIHYENLMLVTAAMAAAATVVDGFAAPTVPRLVSEAELPAAYGRFTASRGAADVIGPALGGVLLQVLAAPLLLVLDAASFFAAAAATLSVHAAGAGRAIARSSTSGSPGGGISALLRDPFLRRCALVVAGASIGNGAAFALLVLFMVRELGLSAAAVGLVLGSGAVGGVLAGIFVGSIQHRIGLGRTAALGGALMTLSLVGLPLAQPGWSGLAACLVYELAGSFGAALMLITVVSEIPRRAGSGSVARGIAVINLVPELAATAGALAGGLLASITSVRETLWIGLAIAVSVTLAVGVASVLSRTDH